MRKQLTAVAVKNLRPGRTRREVRDGGCPGLYLIIQPSGSRSWAVRFRRPGGRTVKLTLGPADLSGREMKAELIIGQPLTLSAARSLAAEVHRQREFGQDPAAERRRAKLEVKVKAAKTFAQAVIDFIEQHAKSKTRRWQERARLLGLRLNADGALELIPRGLADRWRDKPIADVTSDDIHDLVEEVIRQGVPGWARRKKQTEQLGRLMFSALASLFSWLVQKRRLKANPTVGLHKPAPSAPRDRTLNADEIKLFWAACDHENAIFGSILKLLLLTGSRLNEVVGMKRSELSADFSIWTIPGERTKNKKIHVVPLAPLARSILQIVAPFPGSDFVFTTTGKVRVFCGSKVKTRLDARLKIAPWTFHDLRRTFATEMAGLGIQPHVIEACLNHVSGAKAGVAGIYNQYTYLPEKKTALERWADHIESLIEGRQSKVVPLRGSAS